MRLIRLALAALLALAGSPALAQNGPNATYRDLSVRAILATQGISAASLTAAGAVGGATLAITGAGALGSLTLGTPLALAQGGCGATSASTCRTALGLVPGTDVAAYNDSRITGALQAATAASTYAPLASPALTGSPTSTTASAGNNSTRIATTAYVDGAVAGVSISGSAPASPSSSATLSTGDLDRDQYATGTITLTMPNGGSGWRSGVLLNDNASAGLVTLAVPSGATLDGTTNGTTVLFPFQRARVRQTGSTAYRTDWVDRSPIIVTRAVASGSAVATIDLTLPVGYSKFDVDVRDAVPAAGDGTQIRWRLTDDAFSTVKSGASDYNVQYSIGTGGSGAASSGTLAYGYLNANTLRVSSTGDVGLHSRVQVSPGGSVAAAGNNRPSMLVDSYYIQSVTPASEVIHAGFTCFAITTRANGIRFYASTGNLSGAFTVRGIP